VKTRTSNSIQIKRAYEPPEKSDGTRFLVDQLWPRGLKKEALEIKEWLKDVAPSTALRKWFGHEPAKWEEFQRRYFDELDEKPESCQPLLLAAKSGKITLVFSAHDLIRNNAVALKTYLQAHAGRPAKPARSRSMATQAAS
jgi:uncharacterized protein YeaO (DUF488 family)